MLQLDGSTAAVLGPAGGRQAAWLDAVARRFAAELHSDLPAVNQLVEHVQQYRGKMLRPTLVLASAEAAGLIGPDDSQASECADALTTLAVVVEMVHMATLVHDDVLDESQVRRRAPTINLLRGNEAAVMLGDYLISHAYHLCSSLDRPDLARLIAATTNTVCEGELLQLSRRDDLSLDERTYSEIIRRKTASLTGACCVLPVRWAQPLAPEAWASQSDGPAGALERFGQRVGMAFQIVDDLLDLTGRAERVGKTLGRDLAKGKLTLPLILYLQQAAPDDRQWVQTLAQRARDPARPMAPDTAPLDKLRRRLRDAGALDAARQRARDLVDRACEELAEQLPETPGRHRLTAMAQAVIDRER